MPHNISAPPPEQYALSRPTYTPPGVLRSALIIARKDIQVELRTRSTIFSALTFAVLALAISFFAWDPTAVGPTDLAPGVLWVIFTFSGLLSLHRSFGGEQPTRAADALIAAPIEQEGVFLGKALANLVFIAAIQIVTVPAAALLYNVSMGPIALPLAAIVLAAAIGLVAVGTLFSAMAVTTRLAELLLPLLALPFFVPIVICAAQATSKLLAGRPAADVNGYLRLLVTFDIVAVVVCTLTYPSLIEQ
jgi:heme exporter protein B